MRKVSMQGPGPAGSEIQWSGAVLEDGLLITHGKVGSSKPRKIRIPVAKCENRDPGQELAKRYREMLSQGFWPLGQPEESNQERAARKFLKAIGSQANAWF